MNAPFRNPPVPAPRVRLNPDTRKIVAAIAYLIKEGDKRDLILTQYDLLKSLFFADRSHLNNHGRMITHDNYIAMQHGPVPSLAYDILKQNESILEEYYVQNLPWDRLPADHLGLGCFRYTNCTTDNEEDTLSPSDREALRNALSIVTGLTFRQIRELTHGDAAYKEAWALVNEEKSMPMSLGLFYDLPDFAAAEDVRYVSQQISGSKSVDDEIDSILSALESR